MDIWICHNFACKPLSCQFFLFWQSNMEVFAEFFFLFFVFCMWGSRLCFAELYPHPVSSCFKNFVWRASAMRKFSRYLSLHVYDLHITHFEITLPFGREFWRQVHRILGTYFTEWACLIRILLLYQEAIRWYFSFHFSSMYCVHLSDHDFYLSCFVGKGASREIWFWWSLDYRAFEVW